MPQLKKSEREPKLNAMLLHHFLVIAWRNIKRRKLLVTLQVLCLSVGIAAFILVAHYIRYEKNWDKFNDNYNYIFRAQTYAQSDRLKDFSQVPVPVASFVKEEFPEVLESIVVREIWQEYLSTDNIGVNKERKGYWAPSEIFDVFSFKLLRGEKTNVLDRSNSIVLSQSMANRYFPNRDPLGQYIFDGNKNKLVVTGIMEDLPEQSHINADYFRSNAWLLNEYGDNWFNSSYQVFVVLERGTSYTNLNNKLRNLINNHDIRAKRILYLNPLSHLHLKENPRDDRGVIIYFFSFLGVLTLLLACVSFMNLATSFSSFRYVEIGLRKVAGSSRTYLILQFLVESVVMSLISFIVAIFISTMILPVFNTVVNRNIVLALSGNYSFWLFLVGVVVLTGLLSGFYPSFVVSSCNPVEALKRKRKYSKGKVSGLRKMVYLQFVLSLVLITTSYWIYKHVDFLQKKDLGFNSNQVLNCDLPANNSTVSYEALRHQILSHPAINEMSVSINSPMILNWGSLAIPEGGDPDNPIFVRWNSASYHFISTMEMTLIEGRNFDETLMSDNEACLINETASRTFNFENPIGKTVEMERKYNVIGVLKDFNIDDVHNPIAPYILLLKQTNWATNNDLNFRIQKGQQQHAIAHINKVLERHFPDVLFSVNEYNVNTNRQELQIWNSARSTFAFFSIMATIIASIGLFGLVFFASQRRVKEIGIRKAQGASVFQVIVLMTKEFVLLSLASNILVIPLVIALAKITPGLYKYQFTLVDFLLVLCISFVITMVSSLGQAIKAAYQNPIKALRYE